MNITKLPIFNMDEHKLCHITYMEDDCDWTVRTGDGTTITALALTSCGAYVQLETPLAEIADQSAGLEYQINTADVGDEPCPDSGEKEFMRLSNKPIRNASGREVCKLSLKEDGTWGITFDGETHQTILYLYATGAYSQLEVPFEEQE